MGRRQVEESFSSIFLAFFGIIFNDFSKFCCDFQMLNLYRISKFYLLKNWYERNSEKSCTIKTISPWFIQNPGFLDPYPSLMMGQLNWAKKLSRKSYISCSSGRRIIMQEQHFNKSWRPMHQTIK